MPTVIDEMQVQVADKPPEQAKPAPHPAHAPLDPERLDRMIRRAAERRARLAAD